MMQYQNIRLEPADNGLTVSWTTYKPSGKKSESYYEDHKKVFKMNEEDEAMKTLVTLHKENMKHYRDKMKKMSKHGSYHGSSHNSKHEKKSRMSGY